MDEKYVFDDSPSNCETPDNPKPLKSKKVPNPKNYKEVVKNNKEAIKNSSKNMSKIGGKVIAFSPLLFLGWEYYCSGSMV